MRDRTGHILAISTSCVKGTRKASQSQADLRENHGIVGDAHAGPWHRQVSLLAMESIEKMRAKGLDVGPGDFAENLTTRGIDVPHLHVGDRVTLGAGEHEVELEVTQIGKECHSRCAIYTQAGDCVMPREGVFARVLKGGSIHVGDAIVLTPETSGLSGSPG